MKLPRIFGERQRLRGEVRELRGAVEAYQLYSQFQLTRDGLMMRLQELDPRLVDMLVNMSQYETLIGYGGFTGGDREQTVRTARYYQRWKLQAASAVDTWTNWGFGREVNIQAVDEDANEVWLNTWTSPKNKPIFRQESLHRHSERLLVDGEFFFVAYISTTDGTVTWRVFDTERIAKIHHPPNDDAINLYYEVKRGDRCNVLIPDAFNYFALPEEFVSFKPPGDLMDLNTMPGVLDKQTLVLILPVQRNTDKEGRGWPQFYRAFPWIDSYAKMLREYTQVFSSVAAFVDKLKVDGSQRTVTDLVQRLQSSLMTSSGSYADTNPPPTAGATWAENEAVTRTRMPLGSAAGDAQAGTGFIALNMAQGLGVKASDVGRVDMFQNKATADVAAESPQQGWQRYQNFWSSIWSQVVEITLRASEKFTRAKYETYEAVVSMNLPIDVTTEDIKRAMDAVTSSSSAGFLDPQVASDTLSVLTRLLLLDLNASGVGKIFEITETDKDSIVPVAESHVPVALEHACPLCGHTWAMSYEGHGSLLVCAKCGRTYDSAVE